METQENGSTQGADRQWYIVGRWQEYMGEARANLLRIIAIGGFYGVELLNYYGLRLGSLTLTPRVTLVFHQVVTALAVAWVGIALVVLYSLRRQNFPANMKYISTFADLLMLTATLMVADGAGSPLVVALFVLVAMSALRLSLGLVRFATGGALAAYLWIFAYSRWIMPRDPRVPYYHALLFVLALGLTGVMVGQVVRRVRDVAEEYAARRPTKPEDPS